MLLALWQQAALRVRSPEWRWVRKPSQVPSQVLRLLPAVRRQALLLEQRPVRPAVRQLRPRLQAWLVGSSCIHSG